MTLRVDGPGGPYFGDVTPDGGWVLWHKSAKGGAVVVMPAPRPSWSRELLRIYAARVVANLTQRCPVCQSEDVKFTPTAPRQATADLAHEPGCPVATFEAPA